MNLAFASPVEAEGSALGQSVSQGRETARLRRGSLLCACAAIALLSQPAIAVPSLGPASHSRAIGQRGGNVWFADASPKARGGQSGKDATNSLDRPINPPWHITDPAARRGKDAPSGGVDGKILCNSDI